jgi:hypothetical protein
VIVDDLLPEGSLLLEPRSEFDKCILGVGRRFHDTVVVYSETCILEALAADMVTDDEDEPETMAREHFEFNVIGGWVGEATPGFLTLLDEDG